MTIGSLDIALSGLRVAQRALDVTSNNIANAATPGYTRKILPQESLVAGTSQLGVIASEITRQIDSALQRDYWEQLSVSNNFRVRTDFLDRIQAFHGPPSDESAISSDISRLKSAFAELENSPDNFFQLSTVVNQAQAVAEKFNDLSDLIVELRNDAQNQIEESVNFINNTLERIATLNQQIKAEINGGRTSAFLEDQRDSAIEELSAEIGISFFTRDSSVLVVQTNNGQILADENANQLLFSPTPLSAQSFHPTSAVGVFINSLSGTDLAAGSPGGRLGALLELRDQTLPQFQAQTDELAHKLSTRLDSVGLTLFTDFNNSVPADVPGNYVGYAGSIRVNAAIVADPTLLRNGTSGNVLPTGSSETIRRVVEFAFGQFERQDVQGAVDISAGTIFAATGLTQTAQAIGSNTITSIGALDTDPNITAGAQFTIDIGGGPQTITINGGDTATDLVNNINAAVGAGTARLNATGQLILEATADIIVADTSLGAAGIAALGLGFTTYSAVSPSLEVAAGHNAPITITIDPTDTSTDLLASLNAVPGITAALDGSGFLVITPDEGGDVTINNVQGTPLGALGLTFVNVAHSAFQSTGLGPSGTLSTEILNLPTIEDYGRGVITIQGDKHAAAQSRTLNEETFTNTLQRRFLDESGVDIDQEVARLIEIQTAFQAAARMVTASEELFDQLFAAFR